MVISGKITYVVDRSDKEIQFNYYRSTEAKCSKDKYIYVPYYIIHADIYCIYIRPSTYKNLITSH